MRHVLAATTAILLATMECSGLAADSPAVEFTVKPTVASADGKATVRFAVNRQTDVAVSVLDAGGAIVRHLVAGVLGANPPAPLKANSLEQSIEWDGKDDDGKAAANGPFRIQVAAGLNASYAGTVFSDRRGPNSLVDVMGLAAGPDGRVYVLAHRWKRYVAWSTAVHVFRRDGSYEQTIKPLHSDLAEDRLKSTGAFRTPDGALVPIIYSANLAMSHYPNTDVQQQPVVTPDGRLVLAVSPGCLAVIDRDGGLSGGDYAGPALAKGKNLTDPLPDSRGGFVSFNMPYLAANADGKNVYLTGIGSVKFVPNAGNHAFNDHAVYAVALADRGPARVLFGDPAAPGDDQGHLRDPRGLAVDGKGRLLVADLGNNRIVAINEKDGTFAGSMKAESPAWVGVDPGSGAVYACVGRSRLVKYAAWGSDKEVSSVDLSGMLARIHPNNRPGTPMHFALDCSAEPAVLWAGVGGDLVRIQDQGDKFSQPAPAGAYPALYPFSLSIDPLRRDILCQTGGIQILHEPTGEITKARSPNFSGETFLCRPGAGGELYAQPHGLPVMRFDRSGRQMPFEATASDAKLKGSLNSRWEGTTSWPRDFCVDRRGNVYVKNRGKAYHGLMTVDEYGPDGGPKRTAIWVTSDGALGPRIDAGGNLYMAECIKPLGQKYPEIFNGHVSGAVATEYLWMYGSIVKYGPVGGAAWFPPGKEAQPFDGPCGLDPALKKVNVSGTRGAQWIPQMELQGARWFHPGYAYLLDMAGRGTDRCHCTASDFDVDGFGRTFYPDQGLYRVEVLDTNGNPILHIGGYGNQDYCGPDSYVLDPAGKFLRPRKPDDPDTLLSPFAQPDLAFGWFVGLVVSDRYLYVADGVNRRVLRARLDYAASAVASVP
ncbi:MAG: hypothetical protein BIFFINMI_02170 [Phycisphaerae bacterium]|nr:hypothetical protein [Phycisphaerae bacterium]